MQKTIFRTLALSVMSAGLIGAGSAAIAENHHHNNGENDETPFVENSGMTGMSGMGAIGGDHMGMMRSMMGMHMSMTSQMALNGQVNALFENRDADAALAAFDADGDGMMDIDEYATWESQALRGMMVDRFQSIDADGNGDVSLEELQVASAPKSGMDHMNGMGGVMDGMQEGAADE